MKSRPAGENRGKGWLVFGSVPEDSRRNTAICVSRSAIEIGGWESGGTPVLVRIPIDVIERLQRTIVRELSGSQPCDVTGVLLGRVETDTSTLAVDGYELARFSLETGDPPIGRDERIRQLAQRWRQSDGPRRVLGFFRSQRSAQPAIDSRDLKGAWGLLPRGSNIFLLIGTDQERNHTGLLFFRKNRRAKVDRQYAEFSFHADILRAGWKDSTPDQKEPVLPPPPAEARVAVPEIPVKAPTKLAAGAAAGAAAGGSGVVLNEPAQPPPPRAQPPPTVEAPPPVAPVKVLEQLAPPVLQEKLPAAEAAGSQAEDAPPSFTEDQSAPAESAVTEDLMRAQVGAWFTENAPPKAAPFWRSWLSIAATWTIAFGATLWFTNGPSLFGHSSPEAPQPRPVSITDSIGLQVHGDLQLLNIAWDRRSATALNSNGGYMTIRDGALVKLVRLDPFEIRTGHIYYAPRNGDLGIRLEMAAEDGDITSESIRVVGPPVPTGSARP